MDVAAVLREERPVGVAQRVAQEDPPVLGPQTVPDGNAALTHEVEERHGGERRADGDDARNAWHRTAAARFLDGDVRYHDAVVFVSTTTGGAFAVLVAVALVALGFLFRLFLKSGADDARR